MTHQQISILRAELKEAERSYLKHYGWRRTCNTPGSFWLWQRNFHVEDEATVQLWYKTQKENSQRGRASPSKPQPFGVLTVPEELALRMTEVYLDDTLRSDTHGNHPDQ